MKNKLTNIILLIALTSTTALLAGFKETDKLLVQAKKEAGEMKPQKLKKMLDNEDAVVVLDIRESEQRSEGEIYADESYAITRGNLEFEILNKVKNKDAIIVTYCRGGSRGALAAQTLQNLGYKNATNLKGGLKGWAKAGYPIETGLGVVILTKEEDE
ncbi:MAG: phage shock protein E [Sulfurimonas sp.]|jgi:phage shock protein E|uniref:rhodanese-like domain-containing protein n=1 Tax=Sulfurimonas sp. TaxID=2022749 RepID=UPI0039E6F8FF